MQQLHIYNTLSREKELFEPINPPYVGMYVCGPTVYNDVHLGNCRTFTSFDIIYRYLSFLGYKVRYVRNITDVGHLVDDADEGEDKIAKRAKLENLEPMEIVQKYTVGLHKVMQILNNIEPSVEPTATGHLIEQIQFVKEILENGLAYEVGGSVYFDVKKYNQKHQYGKLSGRVIDELLAGQRDLDGQDQKRSPEDFALWKNASAEHIMKWQSPWGIGFPGWHLECSAMSTKYLGKQFDIHGGGMDLKFPHHECEIAQAVGNYGQEPVKYWLHANMLTVNGQKMSKSLGNSILPEELFTGNHVLLEEAFSPMTLRFAILQTHYRSTMDISNDALKAAKKAYKKVMNGLRIVKNFVYEANENPKNEALNTEITQTVQEMYEGMNDDFNTAKTLAALFNLLKKVNQFYNRQLNLNELTAQNFELMQSSYINFVEKVFGLKEEGIENTKNLVEVLLQVYKEAKQNKNYEQVDAIRKHFKEVGIVVKDLKDRIDWAYEE